MHEFKYKGKELYCESAKVKDIAEKVGTPVYIYSYQTLIDHFRKLKDAFRSINPLICFSMKANSSLAVCRALVKEGAGLDVVSGGELFKALKVGVPHEKIIYASVGKTPREIKEAIDARILFFNVESLPELELINKICGALRKNASVCIRANPDIDPKTHRYIKTGRAIDKFGLDPETVKEIFFNASKYRNLNIEGIHVHIGSQITESKPFVSAITKVASVVEAVRAKGIDINYLNIGGGLGIVYRDEKPQTAREFAQAVLPLLMKLKLKVILEPGRFIAGNSGILVAKVIYVKRTKAKDFIVVDAGMNDLIRPALYDAYHEAAPVTRPSRSVSLEALTADVVGPVCESSDFLAKDRILPSQSQGDYLAIMSAGAYGYTMSSNYNSRPRAPEVLVKGSKFCVIKHRENYEDLVRGETIPAFLK